ncbi:hypothetical protein G6F42_013258 [Rhizopus arrhizus]|nr:hypothetical protein G6F42_013258 [Rhizopus arrhizus]
MSAPFPSSTVYTQVLCDSILHVVIPFSSSKANLLTAITAKAYCGVLLSRDSNAQVGMSPFNATNMISSPQISGCGAVSHFNCQKELKPCDNPKLTDDPPVYRKPDYDSPAANALRSLQQQHMNDPSSASTPTMEGSSLSKLKKIATSEEFQNVLVSAAIHSSDTTQPPNEYLANLPPLNPQNTAKNFSRFVSRCGPMFAFRDSVILLLSWNKPIDTLAALIAYCLICLHPKLILLVPHVILLQIIISGYTKKFGSKNEKEAADKDHNNQHQGRKPQPKRSTSASTASSLGGSRFNFASALFPAFDEASPEYLKNMQNLQNMMGEMSDLYDLVASKSHLVH